MLQTTRLLALSLLVLAIGTALPLEAATKIGGTPRVLYLAPRTDGLPGTGTASDPINVSTASRFDAFFAGQYAAHVNQANGDLAQFHFAAGEYQTNNGIKPLSGWSLLGSGEEQTILTLTAKTNLCNNGYGTAVVSTNAALNTVEVANMTIDAGTLGTATAVTGSFRTPGAGGSVTVPVSSTSLFSVGSLVYVQDTAETGGYQTYYGTFTVTGISNGRLTLSNNLPSRFVRPGDMLTAPAGTTVPTTADVFLMLYSRFGIALAGENLTVQDVTVQDTTNPVYEGPCGIDIHSPPGTRGVGNLIEGSTVQIIFGCAGWGISVVYGAPYDGSGNYAQCDIEGCTLLGNGYYQGIQFQRVENTSVVNTVISNFANSIFSDTGPCSYVTIEENTMAGTTSPAGCGSQFDLAGGSASSWSNLTFSGNSVNEKNVNGWNLYLLSKVSNSSFTGNHLLGIGHNTIVFQGGGTGNVVSGNTTK
jgi:hypothetical protein